MAFWKILRVPAVVVLAACGILEFGAGEARSQVIVGPAYETVYVPTRVKVKVRQRRRAVVVPSTVAPTTRVIAAPVVVAETRYVQPAAVAAPIVGRAYRTTTVTRSYYPRDPGLVQTEYLAPVTPVGQPVVVYPY